MLKNAGRITYGIDVKRDPLEELTKIMADRDRISAVLDKYEIASSKKSAELTRLFHLLITNGAGQWIGNEFVPTVVLYDVSLLNLMLDTERKNNANKGEFMALLAIKYVEQYLARAA